MIFLDKKRRRKIKHTDREMTELYWWKKAHMVDGKKVHRMGAMGAVEGHGGVRGEARVLWGPLGFGGLWRAVGAIGVVAVGGSGGPEG